MTRATANHLRTSRLIKRKSCLPNKFHQLNYLVNQFPEVAFFPAQESWVVHNPEAFSFVNFTILKTMLETCAFMTVPDFQRQIEWCQVILQKCP